MKKLKRLGIGVGLIVVGMSGTVQAQTIYNQLFNTSFAGLQIQEYDHIECQLEHRCQSEPPPPPRPGHTDATRQDFNGDGTADMLWRNEETGDVFILFMDGAAGRGALIATGIPLVWHIEGVADFDGDGKADMLWRNEETGDVVMWIMNGATGHSVVVATGLPLVWSIVGMADLNGDGKADLEWRSGCGGPGAIFFMNGAAILSGAAMKNVSLTWSIVPGPTVAPANPLDCPSG